MKTVVTLYDELSDAQSVVKDLVSSGFARDDISLVARDHDGSYASELGADPDTTTTIEGAAAGAVTGGVIGGLGGVLLGLGALAIPGVGPVVAAGPIVAGLTGVAAGAVAGGLVGALIGWGIPEAEAGYYAEGVRRGGTIVAVKTAESEVEKAINVMSAFSPVDMSTRSEYWRQSGWTNYDPNAEPYDLAKIEQERGSYQTFNSNGYDKYRDSFQSHYQRNLVNSGDTFERYEPGYRYGYDLATDDRYGNRNAWDELKTEAREEWEQAEDKAEYAWDEFKETIRHAWEEVKDAFDGEDDNGHRSQGEVDNDSEMQFRNHYDSHLLNTSYSYDAYRPAYLYGFTMANRYQDLSWNDAHTDLRRGWEADNDGLWQDFKDSIQHGWNQVKQAVH